MYNYSRSAQAEVIGQQPRSPYMVTPAMIAEYKAIWDTANTVARPYLPYKPDPNAPNARPERIEPPVASPALWQEAGIADGDMKATTGIYDASLGSRSNETSGRAIMARQREGDVGNYHFFDNAKMAIKRVGEIVVDLIPKVMDTERVVRIIGAEDEKPGYVVINKETVFETLNDLSVGRFDVRISSGPAFSTRREEAREAMMAIVQASPGLMGIGGDLLVQAMDFPKAQELAERIKRTIPPQVLGEQPEAQQQPQGPDPVRKP